MKVMIVLGTRPEIIRLSQVIRTLDRLCELVIVHTGQNYDAALSDIFFQQLAVRAPDHYLGVRGDHFGQQAGQILERVGEILQTERPDKMLILGDTNSGLAAVVAKRMGIPVYHMEAGNRCFDDRVPEEVNRRIIDHCSDVLLPYTERSRENLLREGIAGSRILVTGNPIFEVISAFRPQIQASTILAELEIEARNYFLVTLHRAENVDVPARLHKVMTALETLHRQTGLPIVISTHPRTAEKLRQTDATPISGDLRFLPPFGFFDFVHLEAHARCVLSDSGTVQEECCILRVPNVTLRDVTERPETLACGSNLLSGVETDSILDCVTIACTGGTEWTIPPEYTYANVAGTVAKITLGYWTHTSAS